MLEQWSCQMAIAAVELSVVVVCGQAAVHDADVSEASSDAASLKARTYAAQKSEDSSNCAGKAENEEKKFASVSVKVEPKEDSSGNCMLAMEQSTSSASCVKVNSENLAYDAESVRLEVKDEEPGGEKSAEFTEKQQSASEAVVSENIASNSDVGAIVETTPQLDGSLSVSANVSDVCQPAGELENVCSKTNVDSLIETDSCGADAKSASVSVGNVDNVQNSDDTDDSRASNNVSQSSCRSADCDNVTKSADSQCEDQDQSSESKTDVAATAQAKCSSPQKSRKLLSKQGTTPPDSPGLCVICCLYAK